MFTEDMRALAWVKGPHAKLINGDARTCAEIPDASVNLVITSPPYANNYDYADATRLELCFFGEINGWSDLQHSVRQHLVRACSQHVTSETVNLANVLADPVLAPIHKELEEACAQLAEVRLRHGGKKNYHLMSACYFLDLAKVWASLRRVCKHGSTVCFVIGDSAPYGVYLSVIEWFKALALAAGFTSARFEKFRDRNIKWKNRKHRVPLCEGTLWVRG
jgi:DNA modification methylase